MQSTQIPRLPILILFLIVGILAMTIPVNSPSSGIMTPFYQALPGVYGY